MPNMIDIVTYWFLIFDLTECCAEGRCVLDGKQLYSIINYDNILDMLYIYNQICGLFNIHFIHIT